MAHPKQTLTIYFATDGTKEGSTVTAVGDIDNALVEAEMIVNLGDATSVRGYSVTFTNDNLPKSWRTEPEIK